MFKKFKEMRELARFYELSLVDILCKYIIAPKEYNHLKAEYNKYKEFTESNWSELR